MKNNRSPLLIANWKMNKKREEIVNDVKTLIEKVSQKQLVEIGIAAQDIFLNELIELTKKSEIDIVAQNAHWENEGAFTGETSPSALKDLGVNFVLLGHFERRKFFNETNQTVNKKVLTALSNGLKVIVDIEEFEQLSGVLKNVSEENLKNIVIAFEPIYAIGSGKPASPKGIQLVANAIRKWVETNYSKKSSEEIKILYGGSVDQANIANIGQQSDIDGVLVGSASLRTEEFLELINQMEEVYSKK